LRRLEAVTAAAMGSEPLTAAWVELSRSMVSLHVERDFWGLLEHSRRAIEHYRRSGISGMLPFMSYRISSSYAFLGLFEDAEQEFVRAYATMPAGGTDAMNAGAAQAHMWIEQGRLDDGSALAGSISREATLRGDGYLQWAGRMYVIEAGLRRGTVELAEAEEAALYEVTGKEPYLGLWFLTVLASVRLLQGRAEESVALAERAFARARACGMGYCIRHASLLLVRAEAFDAVGDHAGARRALRRALDDLMGRAARIPSPEVRRSFLENILAHRRTLELAREGLGRTAVAGVGVETDDG
jgi:tetratricopeptide (TPR) repeat protein